MLESNMSESTNEKAANNLPTRAPVLTGSMVPLRYFLPNFITILAICAGLTSIQKGFMGEYEKAIFLILVAAVLDAVDGRVARVLGASSPFGAQLDSLADAVNFGVAPALLLYNFLLFRVHQFGWIIALVYCIACCLRLARFNVMLDEHEIPAWKKAYFVGVPAPAGALLILLPMYLGALGLPLTFTSALIFSFYALMVSYLLVSRLPVWNAKTTHWHFRRDAAIPGMLGLVIYIGCVIAYTWATLLVTALSYLAFLPVSFLAYRRRASLESAGGV